MNENEYVVKRTIGVPTEEDWETANVAKMNMNNWKEFTFEFNSFAKVLHDDTALYVRMETDEMPVVAKYTERNSPVCLDSCMEFFFQPNINNDVYMNMEINALGAFLVGAGAGRSDRVRCMDDEELFEIKTRLCEKGWKVYFKIPFDVIKKYAGDCTEQMRGNFYKCGSETGHRHYGMWNVIDTEKPDFHRPEYFGSIVLEK